MSRVSRALTVWGVASGKREGVYVSGDGGEGGGGGRVAGGAWRHARLPHQRYWPASCGCGINAPHIVSMCPMHKSAWDEAASKALLRLLWADADGDGDESPHNPGMAGGTQGGVKRPLDSSAANFANGGGGQQPKRGRRATKEQKVRLFVHVHACVGVLVRVRACWLARGLCFWGGWARFDGLWGGAGQRTQRCG